MCPQLPAIAHCGELAKLVPEPQVSLPWWQLDKLLPVSILASICDGCVSCLSHPQVEAHVCLSLCFGKVSQGWWQRLQQCPLLWLEHQHPGAGAASEHPNTMV